MEKSSILESEVSSFIILTISIEESLRRSELKNESFSENLEQ